MSKLKVFRELNNFTQGFIAEELGVDQSTYSKLERNPRSLRADQAEKLAEIYKVPVSEILSPEGLTINFSGHIDKNNGYVQNNYEFQRELMDKITAAKDAEISTLKEQVEHLKKQNDRFMKMLEARL